MDKCCKCDSEVRFVYKHKAYCSKCYEMAKGIRDKHGRKIIREEEIKEEKK